MMAAISPSQDAIFTAVRSVLISFGLQPPGVNVDVIQGQINRVPEPNGTDFIVLWPLFRDRLAVNIDDWQDAIIVGSLTSNVLTVASVTRGEVKAGAIIYGPGVTPRCSIIRQSSGTPGQNGTYDVTPTADIASTTLYCGTETALQKTEMTIQADVHGPMSGDNAQIISTLWRDWNGMRAFIDTGLDGMPLFADDPRQIPFENGEQQTEERWIVDLHLEANIAVTTTEQFADQLGITLDPADLFVIPAP